MTKNNIYSPSFNHEAKTKFFEYDYWGISFLIGTVITFLIMTFIVLFGIISKIGLVSILFSNPVLSVFLTATPVILGAVCLGRILGLMLISYRIDNHQIVKAILKRDANFAKLDFSETDYSASITGQFVKSSALNYNVIPEFTEKYFDDDSIYNKQVYHNPVFLRETNRHLIYQTDEKKIKIPKLYDGLGETRYAGNETTKSRIVKKVIIFCLIAVLINFVDLTVGTYLNNEANEVARVEGKAIVQQFFDYGYTANKGDVCYRLVKDWPFDRSSEIEMTWGRDGHLESVAAELYFPYGEESAVAELKAFVAAIPQSFNQADKDEFYSQFEAKIKGDDNYYKIRTQDGNYILVLIPESKTYFRVYFRAD